jgi:hypothetical protein
MNTEENISNSILRRLLKIASKNILPYSILVLGLQPLDEEFFQKIIKNINTNLQNIQNNLQISIDKFK